MSRIATRNNAGSFSKSFLFDFRKEIKSLGRNTDVFYFYPGEVKGFIASCAMATQRDVGVIARENSMIMDIRNARLDWAKKEEEAAWRGGFTFNATMSLEDYEVQCAIDEGTPLDNCVISKLHYIRECVGDYSIDARTLLWTQADALIVNVRY